MDKTLQSKALRKISAILIICCCGLPAQGKYGGGNGTAGNPYLIYDANQMDSIGDNPEDWDKHFVLAADIDLSDFDGQEGRPAFNIIAQDTDMTLPGFQGDAFTGMFDGKGHTISNFTYRSAQSDFIGIFGYVDGERAVIRNVGLVDVDVNAPLQDSIGALVGGLNLGTISNCYAIGCVCGKGAVGGLFERAGKWYRQTCGQFGMSVTVPSERDAGPS